MSKINFPKKQEQRLIPKYLLEYSEELVKNHPDPSASWGGGSGGDYTAGEGIIIENNEISVDAEDVALIKNLATVAFSGSYSDLSNKPDLSVYELKTDAFTGDYDDLTNKPDLSIYELKADAFSGDYNDLSNKPTIPTDTLDLTNGAGYITGITSSDVITALGYTPGTSNFSGNYNDLTNKPTIPTKTSDLTNDSGFITGVTWSDVTGKPTFATVATSGDYDDLINKPTLFSGNYNDLTNKPDLSIYAESADLATVATTGNYNDLTNKPTIPVVPTNVSAFTNDAGYITGIDSTMVTTALGYTPGTSNFSGDYDDLTNKPTIPAAVSGTNDGTNWTSLTIGSDTYAIGGGSTPSNMVTTDTNQNITGVKTFVGSKRIKFKQSASTDKLGFTLYNSSNREKGYLEYNPSNDGLYLGRYGGYAVAELGFQSENASNIGYRLLVPTITSTVAPAQNINYITVSVNGIKADTTGDIKIYTHCITFKSSDNNLCGTAIIKSSSNTAFTVSSLATWLYDHNFKNTPSNTTGGVYMASGAYYYNSNNIPVVGIRSNNGTNLYAVAQKGSNSFENPTISNIVDVII